jgi:hypothetical protein
MASSSVVLHGWVLVLSVLACGCSRGGQSGEAARKPSQPTMGIPNPGAYPVKGKVQTDPLTGQSVVRVSDPTELVGDLEGRRSAMSLIVYSRYTPVNTTGEFVLVHGENSTSAWLYRVADRQMTTVLKIRPGGFADRTRSLGEVNELRWDYSGEHPYRLYFVGRSIPRAQSVWGENPGMSFYYTDIDPKTGQQAMPVIVRDFSKDFAAFPQGEIMNDVEGDSSNDSRHWAWQVMDTSITQGPFKPLAIFSYDRQRNAVLGSLQRDCKGAPVPCRGIDTPATAAPHITRPNMVEFSPKGTRVVVDWERAYKGSNEADVDKVSDGPKAFAPDFSDPIRIGVDATHSGWAWGPKGEEMFVSQNNRNDWIEAVDITSAQTANCQRLKDNAYSCGVKVFPYAELDGGTWTLGMHFGKVYDPAKRGWLFMNTYDTKTGHWAKNQNLLIEINPYAVRPSKVVRLGSSYNLHHDYRSEGSGALDFQAQHIWSTANWGIPDGRGDAFQVSVPPAAFSSPKP